MIEMKELPRARAAGILYAQSCCLAELPNSSPADRGAASVAAGLDSLLSRRLQALAARPAPDAAAAADAICKTIPPAYSFPPAKG